MIFITSLKHPKTIGNMSTMVRLLERTLSTIEAQTCQDFRIIIVCHEIPPLSGIYPHVEYVIVDFPPPADDFEALSYKEEGDEKSTESRGIKHLELVKLDKGKKYLRGLYHARQYNPSHVMFFDADDCLAPTIVDTISTGDIDTSWYVGEGYVYAEGSRWIVHRKEDFHDMCGTCYIFAMSIFDNLPQKESDVPAAWYRDNLGSHRQIHTWLHERGVVLKKIPYPAVTYIISHGENHSNLTGYGVWASRRGGVVRWIRFMLKITSFRLLSDTIAQEFHLG